jgi:hypothetical protein
MAKCDPYIDNSRNRAANAYIDRLGLPIGK